MENYKIVSIKEIAKGIGIAEMINKEANVFNEDGSQKVFEFAAYLMYEDGKPILDVDYYQLVEAGAYIIVCPVP